MSNELKPCPFCGQSDKLEYQEWLDDVEGFGHKNQVVFCNNHTVSANVEVWQTRPLEDALRAKLHKVREQIANTRDLLRTGVAPDLWNYTMEGWTLHKCNKAAGELTRLLAELEE